MVLKVVYFFVGDFLLCNFFCMNRRWILHIDCDAFFASAEQVVTPSLKNRPVVVGDRMAIAVSYEARRFGIKTGMPLFEARRLCKDLVAVKARHDVYLQFSQRIGAILRQLSPLVEAASIDEFYVDMTGTVFAHRGTIRSCCKKVQQLIRQEIGVGVSVGIATNKFCAKMASKYKKPSGITEVMAGEEIAFLSPQSVKEMHGVGNATFSFLDSLGFSKIADVIASDQELLQSRFGKRGLDLWQKARGIDSSVVVASSIQKSIGHALTYYKPSNERELLHARLRFLLEKCCFRMRKLGALSTNVSVSVRYTTFAQVAMQQHVSVATDNEDALYEVVLKLFEQLYDGSSFVRLLSVSLSDFSFEAKQLDLFSDPRKEQVQEVMDDIRKEIGFAGIMTARAFKGKN